MNDNEKTKEQLIQELEELRRMNLKLEKTEEDRRRLEKALRESEQLYHASFEQSPAVKLLIDPKTGEIIDANLAAAEFYGYQPPQLKSMKITDINMLPTDQVQAEIANAFTRQREVFIFRHRLATGEIRTVEVYSGPIQIGDRHLLHSIIHDITERKRAEEALQQSEHKFRLAFQTSPDAININRLEDGLYVDINQGFTDLTGFTREAVIGQTSLEIKIWHDPADRDRLVKGLKEQGFYENLEAQFRRKDGSLTTALMSARVFMLWGVPHILSITRDISERKQADESLRQNQATLQSILNATQESIWLFSSDGIILLGNQTAFQKMGRLPEAVLGKHFNEILPDDLAELRLAQLRQTIESGQPLEFEDERSGIKFRHSFYPVFDQEGRVRGVTSFSRDITEQKRAEEKTQELLATVQMERDRLSALVNSIPDEVWFADLKKQFTLANPSALQEFGIGTSDEATDVEKLAASLEVYRPDGSPRPVEESPPLRALQGEVVRNEEEIIRTPSKGELRYRQVSSSPVRDALGNIIGSVSVTRDITERKQMEEKLLNLNRVLGALNNVNQAMVHTESESDLLNDVCRIVVEDCGYPLVWIGFAEEDEEKTIRPVAQAGFEESYLESIKITWADTEQGRGPTGMAVRTGTPDICQNILTDPRMQPWQEQALKRGYLSSIALPLRTNGRVFGVLTIYARQPDRFSEEEVNLLTKLTDNLAYGITVNRIRLARQQAEAALRMSEEQLRLFIEHAPASLAMFDQKMRYISVSRRWLRDYNLGGRDLTGLSHYEVFPEITDYWKRVHQRGLDGEVVRADTDRFERADGSIQWLRWEVLPWRDVSGEVAGIVVFTEDISELKQAEESFRESEMKYHTLFNSLIEGFCIIEMVFDAEGRPVDYRFLEINPVFEKQTGLHNAEGKLMREFAPDHEAHWFEIYGKIALTGEPARFQNEAKELNRWYDVYAFRFGGPESKKVAICFSDITDRKQAEEALRESEQRFRSVLDNSLDCIYRLNLQTGRYEYISPSVEKVVGFSPEELIELDVETALAMIHPADMPAMRAAIARLEKIGEIEAEYRQRTKNSDYRWISNHISLTRDSAGRPLYRDGTIRDITERKGMEEDLRKSRDVLGVRVRERTAELEQRNKELIIEIAERFKMEQALQKSKEQLQILASQILSAQENERRRIALEVHDVLGSSLSAIKFKVEEALYHLPKDGLLNIFEPLETLIPLIQDTIEEVRRIQADLRPPLLDDLGIVATFSWFCRRFETIYSGIKVEQAVTIKEEDVPDNLKIVLFRITQEAMNNIGKHAKADSVYLGLRKVDGAIELCVKDNGEGFDLESLPSREISKKGLGLSSMKERVEFSGGSFSVESAKGKGTVIKASWPI